MSSASQRPGSLLHLEDLRVEIEATGSVALHGLSLHVDQGEVLALVGESGSGKTMAARAVLGLLPAGIRRTGGRIMFMGNDLTTLDHEALRALRGPAIGMVFQEPMTSLNPAIRIGEQLTEALQLHQGGSRSATRERALDMLRKVQIADPDRCFHAFPHEFSGGMRQRIMLASVMLLKPQLLIADEPTTALDTLSQQQVLDLMLELCRESGTALMLITHNLGLVARYAHRVAVLERGDLVETGPAKKILADPQHPYTRRLVEALPRRGPARSGRGRDGSRALIAVRDLTVTFPGRRRLFQRRETAVEAVRSVSLDIHEGETLALVGASGSGKTTLGRAIAGLVAPAGGTISFRGHDILSGSQASRRDFRLNCQFVYQDPFASLDPRIRIGASVAEALRHSGPGPGERHDRTFEALRDVGLAGLEMRYPHQLSGGQRQRVAIARAIVSRPAFVVADEPVSALDMTIQSQVLKLLAALQADYGFACLFISHDLATVEQVADRVIVMKAGEIVEEGERDAIFDQPAHPYTRELLAATPLL